MRSKINTQFGRALLIISTLVVVIGLSVSPVFAATSAKSKSSSTSKSKSSSSSATSSVNPESTATDNVQGYASSTALQYSTIVELTGTGSNTVKAVSQADAGRMYGVTVDPSALPITVSNTGLQNEAYVVTSGTYDTLVSTQAGTIQPGDFIAISSIDGVGMAAGTTNTTVFGRAVQGFNGVSDGIGSQTLKNSAGTTTTVTLGIIPVAIQIEHNPTKPSTKVNLPKALQRLGTAVAEKPISAIRTYLAIGITGLSTIMALVILYAGVRSGLIAIGRNPLSKGHVFRGLLAVILTSIIVLIIGLFAVYLLLKL
jgi:hypothetical protein